MAIQCLIPAAGKGTRMRPLTHTLPKAMLPVAGKPTIFHIIEKAFSVGIKDFVIITGYLRELMESEILAAYPELNIRFVEQKEQKGLGHALYQAKDVVRQEDGLLVIYGDTLFEADLKPVITSSVPMIGVFEVADPRRFGIIEIDKDDFIINFIEKPQNPVTNLTLPGINYFPQAAPLFDALGKIISRDIKTKDEYQATDAYALMVKEKGIKMKYFRISSWEDAGTLEAMIETNRVMLARLGNRIEGKVTGCKINPPVYVAQGAEISGGELGPYVSIGQRTRLTNVTISDAIIDNDSEISNCTLKNSLIGRRVRADRIHGQAILGDDCIVS